MASERFSRKAVALNLQRRIAFVQKQWNFDPSNGWAQVRGKGEEANRAYGEYAAMRATMDRFDLHREAE